MVSNYYTLRHIAAGLNQRLAGHAFSSLYTQEKDELVATFEGDLVPLVFSCRTDASTLYLHPRIARARKNALDLLPEAVGPAIREVRIAPGDRVVTFVLSTGNRLVARFFGARSNLLLTDADGTVRDAFLRRRETIGTTLAPGTEEPELDLARFERMTREETGLPVGTLVKKSFPVLGATLTRELLFRTDVPASRPAGGLSEDERQSLQRQLLALVREMDNPAPVVYQDESGTPLLFSLIPLRSADAPGARPFDDVHEALRFFLSRRRAVHGLDERKGALAGTLRQQGERDRRTHEAILAQGREGDRAEEYERAGTLLLAHLEELHKGMHTVALETSGTLVSIPLDKTLTPVQNAQRYFEKAKHARTAREQAAVRTAQLAARIQRTDALLSALEQAGTSEELKQFMEEHSAELDGFGLGPKSKEHEQVPFRIFTVDGGFEVWAGKSSENNDLLTTKFARPQDLWFHARGAGGSHVVLRVASSKGEPGKKAREQAAGIAAYYSKMKGAKMVPVAMTHKKFVRKPRGAPAGTVVLEREKVIFAEPRLPDHHDP